MFFEHWVDLDDIPHSRKDLIGVRLLDIASATRGEHLVDVAHLHGERGRAVHGVDDLDPPMGHQDGLNAAWNGGEVLNVRKRSDRVDIVSILEQVRLVVLVAVARLLAAPFHHEHPNVRVHRL